MKPILRGITDTAIYIILFFMLQLLSTLVFNGICNDGTLAMVAGLGTSAILTILIFHFARFSPLGCGYIKTRPYALLAWLIVLSLGLLAPSQYLEEMIPADMPDQTAKALGMVITHPLGFLVVGILAPVAEEMVFRGAILRTLLACMRSPWMAIVVSAVLFGLVHGNVPQFVHALLIGLLLGWVFWRTGSILPGLVVHWVNNSVAFLLCRLSPENIDATLPELFGGNNLLMYAVIIVSALIAALSLWRIVHCLGRK